GGYRARCAPSISGGPGGRPRPPAPRPPLEEPVLRLLIMTTLLVTPASDAWAGCRPKSLRDPVEAQEVARGLLLPKGWVQLEVGVQRKIADGAWTSEGERRTFETKRWIYDQEYVGLRMGLGPRSEIWWQLPFVQATLQHH